MIDKYIFVPLQEGFVQDCWSQEVTIQAQVVAVSALTCMFMSASMSVQSLLSF